MTDLIAPTSNDTSDEIAKRAREFDGEPYVTGIIDPRLEKLEVIEDQLAQAHQYYKKTLEPLLVEIQTNHWDKNPREGLHDIQKEGDAIQKFMDRLPNYAFATSIAVGSNDMQDLYRAIMREGSQTHYGFPEDHFADCRKMITSYADEERNKAVPDAEKLAALVAMEEKALDAIRLYDTQLRKPITFLAGKFHPQLMAPQKSSVPAELVVPPIAAASPDTNIERWKRILPALNNYMLGIREDLREVYPELRRKNQNGVLDAFGRMDMLLENVEERLQHPQDTKPHLPMMAQIKETNEIFDAVHKVFENYQEDKIIRYTHAFKFEDLLKNTLLNLYKEYDALYASGTYPATVENPKSFSDYSLSINQLYKKLLPVMNTIHSVHQKSNCMLYTDMDKSDGFHRMMELVPDTQDQLLHIMKPDKQPVCLLNWEAKTHEIFAQSRVLLDKYKGTAEINFDPIKVNDDLERILIAAYEKNNALYAAQHKPTANGVSANGAQHHDTISSAHDLDHKRP